MYCLCNRAYDFYHLHYHGHRRTKGAHRFQQISAVKTCYKYAPSFLIRSSDAILDFWYCLLSRFQWALYIVCLELQPLSLHPWMILQGSLWRQERARRPFSKPHSQPQCTVIRLFCDIKGLRYLFCSVVFSFNMRQSMDIEVISDRNSWNIENAISAEPHICTYFFFYYFNLFFIYEK